jgi:hypothetical protein
MMQSEMAVEPARRNAILQKINQLKSSLTGYGLEDAATINMIKMLKSKINPQEDCNDEEGCLMCSG